MQNIDPEHHTEMKQHLLLGNLLQNTEVKHYAAAAS